jgi:type I restriction enzyme S subunit
MAGRNVEFVTTIPGRYALSVNDADMPAPKGWAWMLLTDVAQLESGHTPSRNHPEYWDGDIPWIGIKDARAHHGGVINDTLQRVTQAGIDNSAARILPAGTVCLSRTASVGYVVTMGRPMATSQDFVNWVCSPAIDPDYLKWIFRAEGEEGLRKFGKGTTHTTIYFPEVKAFHACIAPLNEQRRIVAKLDAIFEQTRAAKARLERLPALLEKLKRSILAAAFRGDLTADWRAAHPDVEPASALLDRMRTERRRRWEADQRAKGKDPSKMEHDEPAEALAYGLPELPSGWSWETVDRLVANHDSRRVPVKLDDRRSRKGEYPYFGAFGIIDYVDSFIFDGEYVLLAEDGKNLLERARPISLVATGRFWVNNHAHVLEMLGGIPAGYLSNYFNAVDLRNRLTGIDQVKLTRGAMDSMPVPVPPPAEAKVITERLELISASIKMQVFAVRNAAERLSACEQAALAKAFRGELVPQDSNDERASVMLERIRAARADAPQSPRRVRDQRPADAPTSAQKSNGHSSAARSDESLDLVVAALQQGDPRLTAAAITDATNLDAAAVKQLLKSLVAAGQVRVHGKARGTSYEWIT